MTQSKKCPFSTSDSLNTKKTSKKNHFRVTLAPPTLTKKFRAKENPSREKPANPLKKATSSPAGKPPIQILQKPPIQIPQKPPIQIPQKPQPNPLEKPTIHSKKNQSCSGKTTNPIHPIKTTRFQN